MPPSCSTEQGIDPLVFAPAYDVARAADLRLTAHQGENSPATAIATALSELGVAPSDTSKGSPLYPTTW